MKDFKTKLSKILEPSYFIVESDGRRFNKVATEAILTLIDQSLPEEREKYSKKTVMRKYREAADVGYNQAISDVKARLGADGE